MRRLFYDIETSPNIATVWGTGRKQWIDYENIIKERAVICIGYKWEGDGEAAVLTWDKQQSDKAMLAKFSKVLSHSDECVGHNIDRFDWPWLRTRCLFHGIPLSPIKTCDTLQWSRRYHYFNSNRLNYIATFLGVGSKKHTEFKLWKEVLLDNSREKLREMAEYCARDVAILEKVYEKLSLMCPIKTHAGVRSGGEAWTCAKCGSENVHKWQRRITATGVEKYVLHCKDCGRFYLVSAVAAKRYEERNK